MEDTYYSSEDVAATDKAAARQSIDDIDAFERRLNGEAPAQVSGVAKKVSKISVAKPARTGSSYVQGAVKPAALTEAEEEAVEARRALADLELFEAKHGG